MKHFLLSSNTMMYFVHYSFVPVINNGQIIYSKQAISYSQGDIVKLHCVMKVGGLNWLNRQVLFHHMTALIGSDIGQTQPSQKNQY